jgi:hypothetical protein
MSASTARQAVPSVTRRSYVTLAAFNLALREYSYGLNEQTLREEGVLTPHSKATVDNCPKGRILHENGRKLNPADGNFRGANDGVEFYAVGVFDPVSGLSGFIDPNGAEFGLQNTDKPIYLISRGSDEQALGNGVLTNGPIETTDSITAGLSITSGRYLASNVITTTYGPVTSLSINCAAANIFVLNFSNVTPDVPTRDITINLNYAQVGSLITLIIFNRDAPNTLNITLSGSPAVKSDSILLPQNRVQSVTLVNINSNIIEISRSSPLII